MYRINDRSPFYLFFSFSTLAYAENAVMIGQDNTPDEIIRKAATLTPSKHQYEWQRMEFTGFIHFTINTFTDKEWGGGTE